MELPVTKEKPVLRVATRSSTKNREHRHRREVRKGSQGSLPERSDSDHSVPKISIRPIVESEKGVERDSIPIDISQEIREDLAISSKFPGTTLRKVTFDNVPMYIKPEVKVDE